MGPTKAEIAHGLADHHISFNSQDNQRPQGYLTCKRTKEASANKVGAEEEDEKERERWKSHPLKQLNGFLFFLQFFIYYWNLILIRSSQHDQRLGMIVVVQNNWRASGFTSLSYGLLSTILHV